MPSTQTTPENVVSENSPASELDIYAAEFAKLVSRYSPTRHEQPSDWLSRLPDEAFYYYDRGIATFGGEAKSPIDRRGRLYLVHTALVFMWMSWGKGTARERFQTNPHKGTCRTASLITLEHYERGGVLSAYRTYDWFYQPVEEWTVSIRSVAVDVGALSTNDTDPDLRRAFQENETVETTVGVLSKLRSIPAVPSRGDLVLTAE